VTDSKYLPAFDGWLRTLGEDVLSLANLLEAPDAPLPFRRASAESIHYLLRSAELIPEGLETLGYLEGAFAFRAIAQRALVDDPAERPTDELVAADEADRVDPTDGSVFEAAEGGAFEAAEGGAFEPTDGGDLEPAHGSGLEPTEHDAVELTHGSAFDPADSELPPTEHGGVEPIESRAPVPTEGRVPRLAADVALIAEFLGEDMPGLFTLALAPAATTRAGRSAADLLVDVELRGSTLRDARQWVERYRAPELRASNEELVKLGAFFRTRLRREP
jgi:hypothetical protein